MNQKFRIVNFPLIEAARRLIACGDISLRGFFQLLVYFLRMILSLPLSFLQYMIFDRKINRTVISQAPVFILGHYRNGTTYLQKLLIKGNHYGYLTNYDALFANSNLLLGRRIRGVFQNVINLFRIKNPFFNDSILLLSEPTEEDDYLMNRVSAYSAYWGLLFPKKWREWLNCSIQMSIPEYLEGWKKEYLKTLKYITFKNRGKKLILKSPPNTERVRILLEMFPDAKFIFIYRNPYYMYYSIRNMWKKAILGYYSVQKITEKELDDIVFDHFDYLTERYLQDKSLIPRGNLIEISYEDLMRIPFDIIRQIYSELDLPGFEKIRDDLKLQIANEMSYKPFQFSFSDEICHIIEARWGKYLRLWNYSSP